MKEIEKDYFEEEIKKISIDEFVLEVLDGKRNFKKIELHGNLNRHKSKLQAYLRDQNLEKNRFDFSESKLCIKVKYLWLPYIIARDTDFDGSEFVSIDFWRGIFSRANFRGANLKHTNFVECSLGDVNFQEANLYCTDFLMANLTRADLRNAKNFNYANFKDAIFCETKITKQQKSFFSKYGIQKFVIR